MHETGANRPSPRRAVQPAASLSAVRSSCGAIVANFRQASIGIGLIAVGFPLYFIFRALERRNIQADI